MIIVLVVTFFLFMMLGIPVGFAIGSSTLIALLLQNDIPLVVIPQQKRFMVERESYIYMGIIVAIL